VIKLGRVRFKVKDFRCAKQVPQTREEIVAEELKEAVLVGSLEDLK